MKKVFLFTLSLLFLVFSCNTKNDEIVYPKNNSSVKNDNIIITSDDELNSLIKSKNLDLNEMNLEDKMSFLSQHIANQIINKSNSTKKNRADQIVCIAQVYDRTNNLFFTDGAAGNSLQTVQAYVPKRYFPSGYSIGANSNIYRNGINIDGKITLQLNLDCYDEIKASAKAHYSPQNKYTSVLVGCTD